MGNADPEVAGKGMRKNRVAERCPRSAAFGEEGSHVLADEEDSNVVSGSEVLEGLLDLAHRSFWRGSQTDEERMLAGCWGGEGKDTDTAT